MFYGFNILTFEWILLILIACGFSAVTEAIEDRD